MVSALDFQSLILSSIPGGNRSFLLSLHPLRLSHQVLHFSKKTVKTQVTSWAWQGQYTPLHVHK